jgi:uncharacterized protein
MEEKEAIQLLKKHSTGKRELKIVLAHSRAVQKLALEIAGRINRAGKRKADTHFIRTAALLHDIGRFEHPPWKQAILHGVAGARILKKEGLPAAYQKVCMNHLGAGITKADIRKQRLPLPLADYVPRTIEEKIICYADRRIDGAKRVPIGNDIERLKRYGAAERLIRLHEEMQRLMKK